MPQFSNIFVFGKSGAGKQGFIDVLSDKALGYKPLATGGLFRKAVSYVQGRISEGLGKKGKKLVSDAEILSQLKACAPELDPQRALLGVKARYYVNAGLYAPSSVADALFGQVFERGLCKGFVVDGYPRCLGSTAYVLRAMRAHHVDPAQSLLVYVHNEDRIIMERALGRRVCPQCKAVYHVVTRPPARGAFCTRCGGNVRVVQRPDDTREGVATRLSEFRAKTLPAIEALARLGHIPVCRVSGNLKPFTQDNLKKELFAQMLKAVEFY